MSPILYSRIVLCFSPRVATILLHDGDVFLVVVHLSACVLLLLLRMQGEGVHVLIILRDGGHGEGVLAVTILRHGVVGVSVPHVAECYCW